MTIIRNEKKERTRIDRFSRIMFPVFVISQLPYNHYFVVILHISYVTHEDDKSSDTGNLTLSNVRKCHNRCSGKKKYSTCVLPNFTGVL